MGLDIVMAEETEDTLIYNLITEDLNLKETQFEIIKESSSLDGSAVCIVRQCSCVGI